MIHWLPTLSTVCIVTSAILVAFGVVQIKRKNRTAHMKIMNAAAIMAVLFFIIYMSRTIFIGNTSFGGPDNIKAIYQIFLLFHIVLATVGAVMGIVTLIYAYKKNFAKHKRIGPPTSVVWWATAITGVVVYTLLYILYPGGETKSVIDVIMGR